MLKWVLSGADNTSEYFQHYICIVFCIVYPWAHSLLVSNIPSLPHSGILGCRPRWCPSSSPSPSISRCFLFTFLHLPLDFIHVSKPIYLHPFSRLTHFLGEFPGLGLALVPDVVVPEAKKTFWFSQCSSDTVHLFYLNIERDSNVTNVTCLLFRHDCVLTAQDVMEWFFLL